MADFAECVDWIRIFPCLKQFFTQNRVCFLLFFCSSSNSSTSSFILKTSLFAKKTAQKSHGLRASLYCFFILRYFSFFCQAFACTAGKFFHRHDCCSQTSASRNFSQSVRFLSINDFLTLSDLCDTVMAETR